MILFSAQSKSLLKITCLSLGANGLATLFFLVLFQWISATNIAMLYLLVVMAISWFLGRFAGVFTASSSVLLFDIFFVEPRFSLTISD